MYEHLINKQIDKTKEEFMDFPDFLSGQIFLGYDNGFVTTINDSIPQFITMRQCRLQLISMGLDDEVEAAIEAITDPTQKKIIKTEWEYAATVERHNGWIETLGDSLGLSSEQLDSMFIEASKI